MATKIFLTGATGYIGGDALFSIAQAHPEYQITCLVRNSDKGSEVACQYSKVNLVYGDLDSVEVLKEEARKADVVLHCASSDHSVAATALLEGLISHPRDQPGYFIHTSGTGVLTFADTERGVYGEASSKLFNDWDGIGEITALPDFALHREIDKIVLRAGIENASRAKTAIVCPPAIYGIGRGPSNKTSVQIPRLARSILIKKQGIQIGPGKNYWGNVHVHDLSDVYCKLVEAAASGGGKATWGAEGYYFTENGEHVWGHVSKLVASAAHSQGLIPSTEVVTIPDDEANQLVEYAVILWGTNSRAKAIRARNLLQWAPASETLEDTIAEAVAIEAKKLGLIQGHAAKASS